MDLVGAIKFSIPPRSRDFNPVENVFKFVKSELRTQAFKKNINYESLEQFSETQAHSSTLLKTLLPNILIRLFNQCKKSVDGYHVKRARDKVLKWK